MLTAREKREASHYSREQPEPKQAVLRGERVVMGGGVVKVVILYGFSLFADDMTLIGL